MFRVDYNVETEVPVTLLTSGRNAIAGAADTDVTVYIKKYGGAWTAKSLSAAQWREVGSGLYYMTLTAAETDTYGTMFYHVDHASGYYGSALQVEDYNTEAVLLQDIYDDMKTRVSKEDILTRERVLDEQNNWVARRIPEMTDEMTQLNLQIIALRRRIALL